MSLRAKYLKSLRSLPSKALESGEVRWKSPSNIALVKYWGKTGNQIPINPSVSLTLSQCYTDTSLKFTRKQGPSTTLDLDFKFDGQTNEKFQARIHQYLNSMLDIFPFLRQYTLEIESSNSFPHSAGIASSASAFSALALCLVTMEDMLFDDLDDDENFREKTSFVARLGSGSASRSIYAHAAWWGKSSLIQHTSDEFAIPFSNEMDEVFHSFRDAVLVVEEKTKSVSSTKGHHLMEYHPYRKGRLEQAAKNLTDITNACKHADFEKFGSILENEALSLHALMLSSSPGYFLISGSTIEVIHRIRDFRTESGLPCYFTLDAGPNIHLLYPDHNHPEIKKFIEQELDGFLSHVIFDKVGAGPVQLD